MRTSDLKIFTGTANPDLARQISEYLYLEIGDAEVDRFPDGETKVRLLEDVRGRDVFVIQPTCPPVNENLMELLILIDALKRASVDRITAVIPYYGYARQDRKHEGRVPITAKLVANQLTVSGADRVLAMDLHSTQIQGFFDIPMDHIYARPVLMGHMQRWGIDNPVVMSTDVGGLKMAHGFARRLNGDIAVIEKRRVGDDLVERGHIVGKIEGRDVIIIDDMITTAGSMAQAVQTAREAGASSISCVATHGLFCGPAWERLREVVVREFVVTNTVPIDKSNAESLNLTVLSVARLLGEAIKRIHANESVSKIFDFDQGPLSGQGSA